MQWSMSSAREKWFSCWGRGSVSASQAKTSEENLEQILLYHFEILFWKGGEGYDDDVFEKGGKRWGEGRGLRGKVEVTVEEDIEDECVLEG